MSACRPVLACCTLTSLAVAGASGPCLVLVIVWVLVADHGRHLGLLALGLRLDLQLHGLLLPLKLLVDVVRSLKPAVLVESDALVQVGDIDLLQLGQNLLF